MNRGFYRAGSMAANPLNRMECLDSEGDWIEEETEDWLQFGVDGEQGWQARFKLHLNKEWDIEKPEHMRMLALKNTVRGDQMEFPWIHTRRL